MQIAHKRKQEAAGFALIITLSLMILLVVIAVGLLTLSTVSLRASGQASAGAIARENARLGMMIALGELQKNLGPDTAVSADASHLIDHPERPHLTGAWKRSPDEGSADAWHWTPSANGQPDYSGKKSFFKGWLVSTANTDDAMDRNLPGKKLDLGKEVVNLVGSTDPSEQLENDDVSTGVNANKVKLGPNGKWGKYAWGVFDESTKAPISLGDPANPPGIGQEIAGRFAPPRVRADIIDNSLEGALKAPKNLISMDTAKLPNKSASKEIQRRFHDFTTDSFGLLTDTARGGLKYDLTTLFEASTLPNNALPASSPVGPYPSSFATTSGAPNWKYLRDMYKKYVNVIGAAATAGNYTVQPSDLDIEQSGLRPAPETQRLLPVLAKLQVAFSIVSHNEHISIRQALYNANGGNNNFGVIHLVYDPIVTLYNPYDVAIDMSKVRIRIWDPPVGFKFTKISAEKGEASFRPPPTNALDARNQGFYGLARYQSAFQNDPDARKAMTLVLTDGTDDASSNKLRLLPGEVKVYSPRVDSDWSWSKETRDEWNPYAFFDHRADSDFGNVDNRSRNGLGAAGMECVPGWTSRAGFSLDHLSVDNPPRPKETRYGFEENAPYIGAYVPIRLTDSVRVDVKPMITSASATRNFQVDILSGNNITPLRPEDLKGDKANEGVKTDRVRSYSFTLAEVRSELLPAGTPSTWSSKYSAGDLLQAPGDRTAGGKKTIAMLEMSARTTRDTATDSKPWLFNNPTVEGADQNSAVVGLANQSYDLRLLRMFGGFKSFPDGVDIDPTTFRGYFGASGSQEFGSSFVPMVHVPVAPMASLGELVHTSPIASSSLPRVTHPFGNSWAHPLVDIGKVATNGMLDHSYLLNDSLWDRYYFSSITDYGVGSAALGNHPRKEVLEDLIEGTNHALNNRIAPVVASGDPRSLANEIDSKDTVELTRGMAKYFGITGPFNLNSTSVEAWRAVLSSLRDRKVNGATVSGFGLNKNEYNTGDQTPFVRVTKPLSGTIESGGLSNNARWAGFRALTDAQVTDLAKAIVAEITRRGIKDDAPVFSVAEFVNRRIGGDLHGLSGLLQTAIDNSKINGKFLVAVNGSDGKSVSFATVATTRKKGAVTAGAMDGFSNEGTPAVVTQGDLMAALAPIATVRGDTFKIRSYGEATDAGGNVLARAWCEAVVQRVPDFVDPEDEAEKEIPETGNSSLTTVNQIFGRRFNIVSFRWLNDKEI